MKLAEYKRRLPKGTHTIRKKLSDGTTAFYTYAWRGGPRMTTTPGTEAFDIEHATLLARKGHDDFLEHAARIRAARMMEKLDSIEGKVFSRAKSNGRDHSLPEGWAFAMHEAQGGRCAISGLKFRLTKGPRDPLSPSADRIDNSKGYTPDNVHLVCLSVNIGKATMDIKEYIRICTAVARNCRGFDG